MKAAIYCRLSEEDRSKQSENNDSESIQNQKSLLIQYALENGWNVYNIYSDDDYTGSDRNRPAFKKLIEDAENGKFDIILCKTQSRFTRELELVERYIHGFFPAWGIRFISVVDNADTAVKGNKKARQINGLINEWYLEDLSENIKSVLTNRRENGYHIGAFALYGYKKDPERKGHLIIDDEAAGVVREIFTLFSKGYGKTAIARLLNDRGIPNPTEYKRQKGLLYKQSGNRNSTLWKYFTISDMLINEMYIGNMIQGKYGSVSYKTKINKPNPKQRWIKVEGTHDPIIDINLWNRVQDLVRIKARPFVTGTIGLFAGKARCMYCGYVMRSSKNKYSYYLKCPTKNAAKSACQGSFISIPRLEQAIITELHRFSDEYLDKNKFLKKLSFCNDRNEYAEKLANEIAAYEKKTAWYVKAIREVYLDKVKGIISESEFLEFSVDFEKEKARFETLVAESKKQLDTLKCTLLSTDECRKIVEERLYIQKLSRNTIDELIDYILVGRRNPETNKLPIEIYWNF